MTVTSHTTDSTNAARADAGAGLDLAIARMLGAGVPRRPDRRALVAYASWLYQERALICRELYPHLGWKAATFIVADNSGADFHRKDRAAPSTRAEAVLSLVGCDWSGDGYLGIGDDDEPAPDAAAFPDPDARLIDLERNYLEIRAAADEASRIETEAHAEFRRREEAFAKADEPLLKCSTRTVYWSSDDCSEMLVRHLDLSDRGADENASSLEAEIRRQLCRAEARDARRGALERELNLTVIEQAAEVTARTAEKCAELVYRMPARTFAGLALKARVLKADRPELWNRRTPLAKGDLAQWYEIALTEIADGVEHLFAAGRAMPSTPNLTGGEILAEPGMSTADLAALTFQPVAHDAPCPIPSREHWTAEADDMLPLLRMTWLMLALRKEDLVSRLAEHPAEDYANLVEALRRTRDNLGQLHRVAATMMSRMLIATAVAEVRASVDGAGEGVAA